jgi:hypothetical protein
MHVFVRADGQVSCVQEVLTCGFCLAVIKSCLVEWRWVDARMTGLTVCRSCALCGAGDPRGVNDIWLLASEETVRLLSQWSLLLPAAAVRHAR